jgi:hypothetical protein
LLNNKELFVRKVVDTRDYFTHLGLREGNAVVKDSGDLFLLNQRLKALLRCAILLDLGIPEQYLTQPILFQAKRYQLW